MGTMQRNKGKDFERKIASKFRDKYPDATVRRTIQSQRAWNSDVTIEGDAPEILKGLWLECNNEKDPNPPKKLKQAERDVQRCKDEGRLHDPFYRIPVVIWHKMSAKKFWVTMRLHSLHTLLGEEEECRAADMLVTIELDDFMNKVLP